MLTSTEDPLGGREGLSHTPLNPVVVVVVVVDVKVLVKHRMN
jgi:hypothetical protein